MTPFDRTHRHHDPRFASEIAPWVRRIVALNPHAPAQRSRCSSACNRITCGRAAATSDPTACRNDGRPYADARAARRADRARRPPRLPQARGAAALLRLLRAARPPRRAHRDLRRVTAGGGCGARAPSPTASSKGVREPPRSRLPTLRRALPPRRLPPHQRRTARRQGRPRHGRRAPGGLYDADRAELRARARARARPERPAAPLPSAPRRAALQARPAALLLGDPRRGRPLPGRADLPRML